MRIRHLILFVFAFIFLSCSTFGQGGASFLKNRCPNSNIYQTLTLTAVGDINAVPCAGRNFLVNGVPIAGGGTIGGTVSANFFPYATALDTIADSPYGWDGTIYSWDNTALNSEFTMSFTPSNAAGVFSVGDATVTPTNYFNLTQATGIANFSATLINLGDIENQGNETRVAIADSSELVQVFTSNIATSPFRTVIDLANGTFEFSNQATTNFLKVDSGLGTFSVQTTSGGSIRTNDAGFTIGDTGLVGSRNVLNISSGGFIFSGLGTFFDTTGVNTFQYLRTVTAAGTTGNQVINRPVGTVNFAAGATAITVTSSVVNADSLIFATARTNDATCSVKNVVSAVGSFVINMDAACTAETSVGFFVTN